MDGQKHGLLTEAATEGLQTGAQARPFKSAPDAVTQSQTQELGGGYKSQAPASEPQHRNPTFAACLSGVSFCSLTPRNPK